MNTIESIGNAGATMILPAARPAGGAAADTPAATTPAAPVPAHGADLAAEAEAVSRELASLSTYVSFSVDQADGQVVVKVIDSRTKEVMRQIPPEALLDIRRRLDAYLGALTDAVA